MPLSDTSASTKVLQKAFLLLWIGLSIAAIIGMFHLWWKRERVLYWGKDTATQRIEVFQYAGIPISTLKAFHEIDSSWPLEITYKASGNHNKLSYLKYLLIPRIPSGSKDYRVRIKDKKLEYTKTDSSIMITRDYGERPNLVGWVLSLVFLGGVAWIPKSVFSNSGLSVSETWGLSSLLLMILSIFSIVCFNRSDHGHVLFSIIGVSGWILFWIRFEKKRNLHSGIKRLHAVFHFNRKGAYRLILVSIGLLFFLWSLLMAVVVVPDDWDAWAMWGAKAKVMALSHDPLENVTYFAHQDYPLLWPAVWTFSGWCSGGWEEHWSKGWGPLFMLLTAWQVFSIVKRETDKESTAVTAAAMYLSIPMVPLVASWGYAEAPLWLMITCCFGRLLRWRRMHLKRDLVFCAFFAAAAAYTKNEGVLFALLAFVWILGCDIRRWRESLFYYLMPLILLYGPWFYWTRLEMTMGSHALSGVAVGVKRIGETATYQGTTDLFATLLMYLRKIFDAFYYIGKIWLDIKQWNIILAFVLILSIYKFIAGNRWIRMDLMLPLLMFLGYLILTVSHLHGLGHQIGASWNRLTIHFISLLLIIIHINSPNLLMKNQ